MSAQIIIDIYHRQGATLRLASGEGLEGSSLLAQFKLFKGYSCEHIYISFKHLLGIEFRLITNIDARGIETTKPATDEDIISVQKSAYDVDGKMSVEAVKINLFNLALDHLHIFE